jgi:hypothetical protein
MAGTYRVYDPEGAKRGESSKKVSRAEYEAACAEATAKALKRRSK